MEVCTAYIFLQRALQAASKRNAVPQFRHRLEHFIRSEIHQFGELRDEVYRELREWSERYVGTGRCYPKSFLFPRDAASFKQGRRDFDAAGKWLKEWEKQVGPPKPRTSWQDGIAMSDVATSFATVELGLRTHHFNKRQKRTGGVLVRLAAERPDTSCATRCFLRMSRSRKTSTAVSRNLRGARLLPSFVSSFQSSFTFAANNLIPAS